MSALENFRLVLQTVQNLENLRSDMVRNANEHLSMIGVVETTQLATMIDDCADEYLRRLQWQQDVFDVVSRRNNLSAGLAQIGSDLTEVGDIVDTLRTRANQIKAAAKTTDGEIITLCNLIITNVAKADSVWPE